MAITVDKLLNDDRFSGDNVLQFLLYLPFGLVLMVARIFIGLILWVASIVLPNKSSVRHVLSFLACCTFGVYVKHKGTRDPRSSVMVANYVSALDPLAMSHVFGTISLRKWKVPPFFASALGIRNSAQFVRKQHFADSTSQPVLIQPESGPTNGRALLQFREVPFPIGTRIQPVAICVERMFTNVTVHCWSDRPDKIPWSDILWYLWSPVSSYSVKLLPALDRNEDTENQLLDKARQAIADALQIETTEYTWEHLTSALARGVRAAPRADAGRSARDAGELQRLARQVREVLPRVPHHDIMRELARTRSVDITITNFLEGVTPYTPEENPVPPPEPSTSRETPKYITPVPTGVFPKNAKERELSFQDRKAQMIAAARQRYIEKHGLNLA